MAYEVKMGYVSGYNLVFTAYQPDGSGRGIEQQPLPELREGYYAATPLTALEAGDEVIAYVLEIVTWENDQVFVITYDSVFWEGEQISYEGEWVIDYDSTINDAVTTVGAVVGANEYTITATDFPTILTGLDNMAANQNRVLNVYQDGVLPTSSTTQIVIR